MDEVPITSVSEWVLEKIEVVSGVLGLSFVGLETMAWELFAELEKWDVESRGQGGNN